MPNKRPAPLPNSPMAGVTNPTIINGMANERKFPNNELNVTNKRIMLSGKNCPNRIPATIAIRTFTKRLIFIFFMVFFYFEAQDSNKNAHKWTNQIKKTIGKVS